MSTLLETGVSNAVLATLLALPAAILSRTCRRPALVHSLWLLVLLKLLTPAVIRVPLLWSVAEAPAGERFAAAADPDPVDALVALAVPEELRPVFPGGAVPDRPMPLPETADVPAVAEPAPDPSWTATLLLLWLAGSVVWFGWAGLHVVRFRRLLRRARPAPARLQQQTNELARRLGLRAPPAVWLVPGAVSPMVWALGCAPRLLFPARLLERLDDEQRATLLVHELAHVRRRDHWVRCVELLATGLYWWHPVVWWARRELHEAEEQCCDAWVVWALDGAARAYALALVQTVAFFSHTHAALPPAASGIGQVPHLRRRLTMIMQGTTTRSLSWAGCLAMFGLALLVLPLAAQEGAPKEPDKKTPPDKGAAERYIEVIVEDPNVDDKGAKPAADAQHKVRVILRKDLEKADEAAKQQKYYYTISKDAKDAAERQKYYYILSKDGAGQKSDSPDVQKARQAVEQLAKQIAVKHQELKELEVAMQQAAARLRELQVAEAQKQIKVKVEAVQQKVGEKMKEKKGEELEDKLDRLLKEVEELRREVRKEKSPNAAPLPKSKSDPKNKPETKP